ncbi:hypothetical protein GDO81_007022 [Engystomops pustulosus]|uniref:Tail-anchored protein insertion receptor WRB n=1 Tax=Engystomops pustulosus TaxID=76066 RepID=A0AAV7D0T6_ENGPU|nr:hypothetical protein GDO81_007022 [Engystomops pustulosus]
MAEGCAWLLVLLTVFLCNLFKTQLPSLSTIRHVNIPLQASGCGENKHSAVKARTGQQAKIKWVVSIVFYVLQAALMVSLIWKYYSEPVMVLPSKWIAPLERLVAFPTGIPGAVGITCWLVVCNKVVALMLYPIS